MRREEAVSEAEPGKPRATRAPPATVDGIPLRFAAFAFALEKVEYADRLRGYV